jgi:hypothetical protein
MTDLKTIARTLQEQDRRARMSALTEMLTVERVYTFVLKYVVSPLQGSYAESSKSLSGLCGAI